MLSLLLSQPTAKTKTCITIRINTRKFNKSLTDVLECHKSNRRDKEVLTAIVTTCRNF